MKTIFNKTAQGELIDRIKKLDKNSTAQWGKMNLYQMTKHCTIWDEWVLGKNSPTYKQAFLGWIFGKRVLKGMVKDDTPLKRNMPAGKIHTVKEKEGDIETQKKIWADLIADYEQYSNPGFVHDFFGKMSQEEIGILAYKHSDHNLRQFGA